MLDENKHQTRQLPHQGLYLEEIWNFQDSGQKYSEKKNPLIFWVSTILKLRENT